MILSNEKPETFIGRGRNLLIRDRKQKLFYFHPNGEGEMRFNLPKGIYFTRSDIKRTEKKDYPKFLLPPIEHYYAPKKIKIIKKENPCKATITPSEGNIVLDERISKLKYSPALVFIKAHEFGHHIYSTENFCDMFAANFMLEQGFNPSQITMSYKVLFRKNDDRKTFLDKLFEKQNFLL